MNNISEISCAEKHAKNVAQYYRLHAPIYDVTRWSFLFGRKTLIDQIPSLPAQPNILEVGCGTGKNLIYLKQRFPDADITGIDLSTDMIGKAHKNITTPSINLKKMRYGSGKLKEETYDLILLSYTLTMMGAEYSYIVSRIKNNLNANGYLAVVDFHTSPFSWFRKWMNVNHVDFSGDWYPLLEENFSMTHENFQNAYFGLWNYVLLISTKK